MSAPLRPTKNESDEVNEGTKRANIPRPHSAMFRGNLGQVVQGLAPSTEAHPTAILVQTLALLAGYIGDGPHVEIGGTRHPARIWPLIMGPTAKGRKGESKDQALKLVRSFTSSVSSFVDEHVSSGLSSGEGLVAAFKADADGCPQDPRLVVIETEYARVLSVSKRDGNTLPTILRDLWDRGSARTLTRAAPLRLEGAHLVVIGHITPIELRLKLSAEDVSGGSINRQLLILVERTKLLPDPPAAPAMLEVKAKVERAVMQAREKSSQRCYRMTRDARHYWADLYTALDRADTGGAMSEILGRAPAYTQRLALLYALLDGAPQIDAEHLRAGLAVVKYSMDSARLVFGNGAGTGDLRRLADEVRKKKRMARTEVSAFFNRNKKKEEIDALIDELVREELVEIHMEPHERGRPTEYLVTTNKRYTDHVSVVLGPEDEPLSGFPALRAVE